MKLMNVIMDILSPNVCVLCGKIIRYVDSGLCDDCSCKVIPARISAEAVTERKIYYDAIFPVWKYDRCSRQLIVDFKNGSNYSIAIKPAKIISDVIKAEYTDIDVIIPVPVSTRKIRKRGFNQALVLGKAISEMTGIPLLDIVRQKKKSEEQKNLNFNDRLLSALGKFTVKKRIDGLNAALVDDVHTTGATANEISRVLKVYGALKVFVFVMAKVEPFEYDPI